MSFEDSQQTERVTHATLVFEHEVPATVEKVFAAFANAKSRSEWGAPSDTATIIYDQEDSRIASVAALNLTPTFTVLPATLRSSQIAESSPARRS